MDEKELAGELQASKNDPDEWGDAESGAMEDKKRLSAMVSIRLAKDELEQVQRRAQERGQSVSAYLREVALRDAGGAWQVQGRPFGVQISTGGTYSASVYAPRLLTDGRRLATSNG
jgi:hypothetical protein